MLGDVGNIRLVPFILTQEKAAKSLKYVLLTGLYLIWGLVWGCSLDPKAPAAKTASTVQNASQITLYPLKLSDQEIDVELACSVEEQSKGLMFRSELPQNQGMLFVFPQERTLSFWMKNTLIPLDIAYIDAQGKIIDIQQMQPQTTTAHPSKAPAKYALEMNQHWFKENKIEPGTVLTLPACPESFE